jgi:hypothetical protein
MCRGAVRPSTQVDLTSRSVAIGSGGLQSLGSCGAAGSPPDALPPADASD